MQHAITHIYLKKGKACISRGALGRQGGKQGSKNIVNIWPVPSFKTSVGETVITCFIWCLTNVQPCLSCETCCFTGCFEKGMSCHLKSRNTYNDSIAGLSIIIPSLCKPAITLSSCAIAVFHMQMLEHFVGKV